MALLTLSMLISLSHRVTAQDHRSGAANRGIALVVGIDTYANLGPEQQLLKAANDARSAGDAFERLGYRVFRSENAGRAMLLRQWQEFLNVLQPGDTVALYFAGHGIEIEGQNYLLPGDVPQVKQGEEEVLKGAALGFEALLDGLRRRSPRVSLVILDACRDNPFQGLRTRSTSRPRGLADAQPTKGMFVMYSAGAGQKALDVYDEKDRDPNSVYTRALLPLLTTPGLDIAEIARRVRRHVNEAVQKIGHAQTPAYYDEVIGDFCPAGCGPVPADAVLAPSSLEPANATAAAAPDPASLSASRSLQPTVPPAAASDFDGVWEVKASAPNCPLKAWNQVWTISGNRITGPKGQQFAAIDRSGAFAFAKPAAVNKKLLLDFTGTVSSDGRGKGNYATRGGPCRGSFTLRRVS